MWRLRPWCAGERPDEEATEEEEEGPAEGFAPSGEGSEASMVLDWGSPDEVLGRSQDE